jgi:hypothetical protein
MEQSTFKPVNYKNNSKLENKFFGDYIRIIIEEMNPTSVRYDLESDLNEVADLIVELPYDNISVEKSVAFRIRNYDYINFNHQFTLRQKEFDKIYSGKGHYYLYGFCNEEQSKIIYWTLFDLDIFRKNYNEYKSLVNIDVDGTLFYSFNFWRFPENMIISQFTGEN